MCVASFFARVNERKLEREKKNIRREREKKKGESFPIRNVGVEGGENLGKKSARAHKRRAKKPRERREKRGWWLSRFAPSVTRVVIFVSRAFRSAD